MRNAGKQHSDEIRPIDLILVQDQPLKILPIDEKQTRKVASLFVNNYVQSFIDFFHHLHSGHVFHLAFLVLAMVLALLARYCLCVVVAAPLLGTYAVSYSAAPQNMQQHPLHFQCGLVLSCLARHIEPRTPQHMR